jgi:hypothetical protein
VEIKEEAGRAGRAVAMGAAGAVVAICALLLIGMTIAWALDEALPTWLSFGLVALVYVAVAVALVMAARARVAEISLPPTQTTETLQEDKEWLQQHRS